MKKVIYISTAFLLIGLSSCRKDRTCSCTHTVTDYKPATVDDPSSTTNVTTTTSKFTVEDVKKNEAENGICSTAMQQGNVTSSLTYTYQGIIYTMPP